jgi:hypothetical protein
MTVFSGEDCENLKCVDANIASAAARVANDASTVEWKTTVIFLFLVHLVSLASLA